MIRLTHVCIPAPAISPRKCDVIESISKLPLKGNRFRLTTRILCPIQIELYVLILTYRSYVDTTLPI